MVYMRYACCATNTSAPPCRHCIVGPCCTSSTRLQVELMGCDAVILFSTQSMVTLFGRSMGRPKALDHTPCEYARKISRCGAAEAQQS